VQVTGRLRNTRARLSSRIACDDAHTAGEGSTTSRACSECATNIQQDPRQEYTAPRRECTAATAAPPNPPTTTTAHLEYEHSPALALWRAAGAAHARRATSAMPLGHEGLLTPGPVLGRVGHAASASTAAAARFFDTSSNKRCCCCTRDARPPRGEDPPAAHASAASSAEPRPRRRARDQTFSSSEPDPSSSSISGTRSSP
jgi:hypothetical protein